jgi:hypothetical protein
MGNEIDLDGNILDWYLFLSDDYNTKKTIEQINIVNYYWCECLMTAATYYWFCCIPAIPVVNMSFVLMTGVFVNV